MKIKSTENYSDAQENRSKFAVEPFKQFIWSMTSSNECYSIYSDHSKKFESRFPLDCFGYSTDYGLKNDIERGNAHSEIIPVHKCVPNQGNAEEILS